MNAIHFLKECEHKSVLLQKYERECERIQFSSERSKHWS